MTTQTLKQGTPEWFAARVGRVTASRIAAVLGDSDFTSQKELIKQMVNEGINGAEPKKRGIPPLEWGTNNEPKARAIYEFLYLDDKVTQVEETGFWTDEWEGVPVGASPDGLVGDDGLVEIKCPYGLRNEASPHFKSINDIPGYMHQIQMQLHITGREWCDFFQWTPKGHKNERVYKDPLWWDRIIDTLRDFFMVYTLQMEKAISGRPEDRLGASARWTAYADAYLLAKREREEAEARESDAKEMLYTLCEEAKVDECTGGGVAIARVTRAGTVNYRKMVEVLLPEGTIKEKSEEYRSEGSSFWRLTEAKE